MKVYIRGHKKKGKVVGRAIRWFTFGLYKHTSMVFEFDDGTRKVHQSTFFRGVHWAEFRELPETDLFEVPANQGQIRKMLAAAESIIGKKYDRFGIYGFALRKDIQKPDMFFCSETNSWVAAQGGVELQRLPFHKQSPVILCASPVLIPVS